MNQEQIERVLMAHRYDREGCVCTCSNEVQVGLNCDEQTHEQHVAEVLALTIQEVGR